MAAAEGGQLRKGLSVRMKKNIISCQPFKEGASTIICSGCHALMAYPCGSSRVRCTACNTITTGIKVPCTSCKKPLRLPIKLDEAVCPSCKYRFQPISTFRLALPSDKEIKRVEAEVMSAPQAKPKMLSLVLIPSGNLNSPLSEITVMIDENRPLESCFTGWSTKLHLNRNVSFVVQGIDGELYKNDKSCKEQGISDGDMLNLSKDREEGVGGSHQFKAVQFMKPTNCAYCHKFIWGVYKQGQRCTRCWLPVHHRCASKVTCVCEAAMREACGLSITDFGEVDEETADVGGDIPEGFPIDEEDMADWEEMYRPTKTYEGDGWMKSFGKLTNWTDEDIAKIWTKYDADKNGSMDRDELKAFLGDLIGAEGGKFTDESLDQEVSRVLRRMDTNNDGIIQWEEFWYFHQAQKASNFLAQFQGCAITEEKARELWDHYDEDGNGTLDTDEIRDLLCDCARAAGCSDIKDIGADGCGFWEGGEEVTWDRFREVFLPIITESIFSNV